MKKLMERAYFSDNLDKIVIHRKHIGYNLNTMCHSAFLANSPVVVNNLTALRWMERQVLIARFGV